VKSLLTSLAFGQYLWKVLFFLYKKICDYESGANCRSVALIAPLVSGVAGLSASSSSKADILNIWCKNCRMWQLPQTIIETSNIQTHCFLLLILLNVLLQKSSCFNYCFQDTDISHGSVATHLRNGGICSNSIITIFFWFRQWKNFKNWLIFGKVIRHTKNGASFLAHPVYAPPALPLHGNRQIST